jgi:hypothetical protein
MAMTSPTYRPGIDPDQPKERAPMRIILTFTAGLASLALSAGTVVTMAAQSPAPPDPNIAVVVDGSAVSQSFVTPGTSTTVDGVTQTRGWSNTAEWEASDPRLSGQVTFVNNHDEYASADGVTVETGSYRLSNAGGSWSSASTSIAGNGLPAIDTIILSGEGAYAGLTAYLIYDYEKNEFRGAIFPA